MSGELGADIASEDDYVIDRDEQPRHKASSIFATPLLGPRPTESINADIATKKAVSQRLLSLDVFRGLTMVGMILVDNQGHFGYVYEQLSEV